jgi:hypothetical protein
MVKSVALVVGASALAWVGIAFGSAWRTDPGVASPRGPVVVELFTSEGCSSCPPADAWLSEIAEIHAVDGVPVIALSEHVDYWNRLGWKDPFSSAAITARQGEYARSLGSDVYTPQVVVDGTIEFVGSDRQAAARAIRTAAASKKASITADLVRTAKTIDVRATVAPGSLDRLPDADVFIALTEDGLLSNVAAGENEGRRLAHDVVTRYLRKADSVKKGSASTTITAAVPIDPAWSLQKSRLVLLIQQRGGGKIVGAWSGAAPLEHETRLEGR